jgi:hypothetical protein
MFGIRCTSGVRSSRRVVLALAMATAIGAGVATPVAAEEAPSADLSVTIGHSPASPLTATELTFTVTIHNDGPDPAADLVLGLAHGYPLQFEEASEGCEPGSYNGGTICSFGELASGSDVVATITLRPTASGIYTVPAVVSSETADPDAEDRTATDTVIVRRGPSQGERYIRGTFPLIFDRDPDPGAVTYWADRWNRVFRTGQGRLIDVPIALLNSSEYRRLRVRQAYLSILGRAATPSDVTYWSGRSAAGLTYDRIEQFLFGSGSFKIVHAEDGVAHVFQVLLGRPPTPSELSSWNARVAAGSSYAGVAASLQRTTERWARVMNQRFLQTVGHAATNYDKYLWFSGLLHGATPERLWAELLIGGEYLQKYPRTEDDYGYPIYDFSATRFSALPPG